jgi:hypothetical protein
VKESRIFAAPVEVREQIDNVATIAGYGAVFSNEYEVAGFTESVSPRAFVKTLKQNADHAVVWSHDAARVLGTTESGSARFEVDERGLRYEADLDLADPDGMGAYRKIATGKVRQSSFSFEVVKDKWEQREDALPHRTLTEVRLYEASPVLWGANPETDVDLKRAMRSMAVAFGEDPVPEQLKTRDAATQEPADEPPADASEPEPKRVQHHPYV